MWTSVEQLKKYSRKFALEVDIAVCIHHNVHMASNTDQEGEAMNNTPIIHIEEDSLSASTSGVQADNIRWVYKNHFYTLGLSPEGVSGREDFGSEPTTDLFGYLFPEPTILTNPPQPMFDGKVINLEDDDHIHVEGHGTFRVSAYGLRGIHPKLTTV